MVADNIPQYFSLEISYVKTRSQAATEEGVVH